MKCPVCAWEHPSMLCPRCSFDSSRDYGKYPTFGPVEKVRAVSTLRMEWEETQKPPAPEETAPQSEPPTEQESPAAPAPVEKPRKKLPWIAVAVCAVTLVLGIWIGSGLGGGAPAEPGENVQAGQTASESSDWRVNVLKKDDYTSDYVYGTNILISSVKTVTFLDTLENAPEDAVDVSANGDGSVKLWSAQHGETYDLYYAANGGINGKDACQTMFYRYFSLETIDFGESFHTDEVLYMSNMFAWCESLTALDLSSFNTSNVQTMNYMFFHCRALTKLNLSSFDTAKVQYMSYMFEDCPAGADWQHLVH